MRIIAFILGPPQTEVELSPVKPTTDGCAPSMTDIARWNWAGRTKPIIIRRGQRFFRGLGLGTGVYICRNLEVVG